MAAYRFNENTLGKASAPVAVLVIAWLGLVSCDQSPKTIELRSSNDGSASGFTESAPDNLYEEFGLTAKATTSHVPIMELTPKQVCSGVKFRAASGELVTGNKNCGSVEACSKTGQIGCKTGADYVAFDKSKLLKDQLEKGKTFLGIAGDYVKNPYTLCTGTNQTGCTSTDKYLPIDKDILQPKNIKKGVRVADGLKGKYPSNEFPLSGAAANTEALAEAGVNKAAAQSKYFHFWDANGTPSKVRGDSKLNSLQILTGNTVYGVGGNKTIAPAKDCQKDGDSNCKASASWKGLDKDTIYPQFIRKDIVLGGKTGEFPSASSYLPLATHTVDLNLTNFNQLRSTAEFEYFDKNGKRYHGSGLAQIKADNIMQGIKMFGVMGSLAGAKPNSLNRFDLRKGLMVPGKNKEGALKVDAWCLTRGVCEGGHWQDITDKTNPEKKKCSDKSDACVFRSFIQMNDWAFPLKKGRINWKDSVKTCQDMNLYGKNNWRMPTQKEMMMAVGNSLVAQQIFTSLHYKTNTDARPKFWTSTAHYPKLSGGIIERFVFDTQTDGIGKAAANTLQNVLCIRELEPAEAADAKAKRTPQP